MFMALLFLVTGLGVGVYAFWQATHSNNSSNQSANTSQTQTATNAPTCVSDPNITFNSSDGKTKLAGQQLADYTPAAGASSLSCIDVKIGTGSQTVQSSSTITANYTGAVAATGKIFQSSLDNNGQPFSTPLSDVIPGWQTGLLGMKAGGERRLLIPASLAYGATPPAGSGIPANAALVFDITVIQIQ